jgi:hypothetical protein
MHRELDNLAHRISYAQIRPYKEYSESTISIVCPSLFL